MKEETIEEFAEKFIEEQKFISLEQDDIIFEAMLWAALWQLNKIKIKIYDKRKISISRNISIRSMDARNSENYPLCGQ
jgi:hypothetical protein